MANDPTTSQTRLLLKRVLMPINNNIIERAIESHRQFFQSIDPGGGSNDCLDTDVGLLGDRGKGTTHNDDICNVMRQAKERGVFHVVCSGCVWSIVL